MGFHISLWIPTDKTFVNSMAELGSWKRCQASARCEGIRKADPAGPESVSP